MSLANATQAERDRRWAPPWRLGIVVALDEPGMRVRVNFIDHPSVETAGGSQGGTAPMPVAGKPLTSYWLRVLPLKAMFDKDYWMPELGEAVTCIMDDRDEDGWVIGSEYNDLDRPCVQSKDKRHYHWHDGTWVEYDRAAHLFRFILTSAAKFHVVIGDSELYIDKDLIQLQAKEVKIKTSAGVEIDAKGVQIKTGSDLFHVDASGGEYLQTPAGPYFTPYLQYSDTAGQAPLGVPAPTPGVSGLSGLSNVTAPAHDAPGYTEGKAYGDLSLNIIDGGANGGKPPPDPQPPGGSGGGGGSGGPRDSGCGNGSGDHTYDAMFAASGAKYGIDPGLLKAIAIRESGVQMINSPPNTNGTLDYGIMQINSSHGSGPWQTDPAANIDKGAQIMAANLHATGGDIRGALSMYNSGSKTGALSYADRATSTFNCLKGTPGGLGA